MAVKESVVRDYLRDNLELIEAGLELVDDEFYLANKIGTSGFVDIMARDRSGRLVVIEVKVSKHSEREAITELYKYLALLKQNMSIKDSEVRLFVVSTDWRELLLPFSEFVRGTAYGARGLIATIDEKGEITALSPIALPEQNMGRRIIPRHWLQVYQKMSDRDSRSEEYAAEIKKGGY